jgi:hypothetical protein
MEGSVDGPGENEDVGKVFGSNSLRIVSGSGMGCSNCPPGRAGKRPEPEANRGMTLGKLDVLCGEEGYVVQRSESL